MSIRTIETLYEQVRAAAPAPSAADVTPVVTTVVPGIRVLALRTPTLPPAAHTNVYLVGPPGNEIGPVAVVDPGSPYLDQQAALDQYLTEVPIACVLLTHHHGDHIGGAAALAARWGVPIAAHAATARRLEGIVEVTQLIEDGELVHGMTAVHTPGHAEGHLCFEHAASRATIAGDMVAGIGTILIDPSEGDMALYLASLELLLARPAMTLLPAHRDHRRSRQASRISRTPADARGARARVADRRADLPRWAAPDGVRRYAAHAVAARGALAPRASRQARHRRTSAPPRRGTVVALSYSGARWH
jgi:glyoxylase-like metal-dependent hydrolase (beta-lactamase superfamily II)